MHPFIQDGDFITVEPLSKEKPAVGKVAAFLQSDSEQLVIHRIIRISDSRYLTKGDNIPTQSDGWIPESKLIGCISHVSREGRRIRFGLNLERIAIAWLSSNGILVKTTRYFARSLSFLS